MSVWFKNIASQTEDQFMLAHGKNDLYTTEYLHTYYNWFHRNESWQKVVETFCKTNACAKFYPDLFNKSIDKSPPS